MSGKADINRKTSLSLGRFPAHPLGTEAWNPNLGAKRLSPSWYIIPGCILFFPDWENEGIVEKAKKNRTSAKLRNINMRIIQ
jgi:hypothetical protein